MSNIEITITLPEELVERAKAVELQLDSQTRWIVAALEAEIKRREAGQRLIEIAEQLHALPDDLKPTPEEIEAEIRAYRAEKTVKANEDTL